jgi:hypothetical protein
MPHATRQIPIGLQIEQEYRFPSGEGAFVKRRCRAIDSAISGRGLARPTEAKMAGGNWAGATWAGPLEARRWLPLMGAMGGRS